MRNIKANIVDLYKELTPREFAVAIVLSHFVSDDGLLRLNGKYIVGTELCEYLEENYNTFNRHLTSLCRKGIIGRVRMKTEFSYCFEYKLWCVNPYVYKVDNAKSEIVEYFNNSKWK